MANKVILHDTPCPLDKLKVYPEGQKFDIIEPAIRDSKGRFVAGTPPIQPNGRPKKENTITDQVRELLKLSPQDAKEFKPSNAAQVIAHKFYLQAMNDPQLLKELLNRLEGKVIEQIELDQRQVSIQYELVKNETH